MNAMEEVPLVVDTCYTDHGSLEFVFFFSDKTSLRWGQTTGPTQKFNVGTYIAVFSNCETLKV